jgi:hypothetical protein
MLTIKKLVGALETIAKFIASGPPADKATLALIAGIADGTLLDTKAEIAAIANPSIAGRALP